MKKLLSVATLFVMLVAVGCQKSTDDILNEHRKPIVVVSKGTVMGDCCMKFQDADGKYFSLVDNSLEALKIGDTLRTNGN